MAWISVHEGIMSVKLRTLARELKSSQNEALGILVRLWLWGIHNADAEGNITAGTKDDVADVLTIGLSKDLEPLQAVEALIVAGYLEEGEPLKIHDWQTWQAQWYKALKTKEETRERVRKWRENQKEVPEKPKRQGAEYPADFEQFWQAYPRKIGKGEAYKCYKARVADGWSPADLEGAARAYAASVAKQHIESTYIKHAKTFLSAATPFTDYLQKKQDANTNISNNKDPFGDWR